MKLYLLYKTNAQEGNFGDCESAPSILCGIFEDEASSILAKSELEKTCITQEYQFGSHKQTIKMIIVESNKIIDKMLH